jgi:L-ascorbate metabolism protein UlaG (beta-lactamase superfamily)
MIITSLGLEAIKVQFGDTVLAFNPVSKDSKLKSQTFGSDVVLVSLNHPDTNGVDNAGRGDKQPFAVTGPGEYEVSGVFIKGFQTVSHYGDVERINTVYSATLEGMNMLYLGAIDSTELAPEIAESIDTVDILFVPIGGEGVLSASDAYKLAVKFEPSIIIPIHYGEAGDKDALKTFIKESGNDKISPVEKLTIKKKDIADKQGEVVVIKSA